VRATAAYCARPHARTLIVHPASPPAPQMGCSLITLMDSFPALLQCAMGALTSTHEPLAVAAADALVDVLSPMNTTLSPAVERQVTLTHLMADQLQAVAATLGVPEASAAADGALNERQYHFCRALCAFAERAVDIVAATDGRLLPLVHLLFVCLSAELRVAELTVDFWACIQDTPLASRHAQLGQPLYRELLKKMLSQCTLPTEFSTWEEELTLEEDDFERFREQSAQDLLATCLQLLGHEFVASLRAKLEPAESGQPPPWQQLELVCYAVRALHAELKTALGHRDADTSDPAAAAARAALQSAIRELVGMLLTPIAHGALAAQPAAVRTSAVRLVGSFGKLIATEHPTLLEGAVHFVLSSLQVPSVAEHAANAFRAICVHAQKQLGKFDTVVALLRVCEPALSNVELSAELRIALMEGLARLAAVLPARDEHAKQALGALLAPPCTQLQATLAHAASLGEAGAAAWLRESAEGVATQVALIGGAIRFCDRYMDNAERNPVLPVMQGGVWALLMQTAQVYHSEGRVMQAMCDLYSKMMVTMGKLMRPLLPQLLQSLAVGFSTTPVVGVLTTLRDAIERYGGEQADEELAASLAAVMTTLIESICAWLTSTGDPESQPELLTAFWEMCHGCLVFSPGLLLTLPCATGLFDAAVGCVRHQEFMHTRAVLSFICLFMCPTDAANPYRETSVHCIQTSGKRLLRECLAGLSAASPDNLVDHQVELLRVLIEACPGAVATWLRQSLDAPEGLPMGAVDPQGKTMQAFAALALRQPALPQAEFQSVASDFSRICRGKLGADALDRHLMRVGP